MTNYSIEFLKSTHKLCVANRKAIETSKLCGCFYCCKLFPASLVVNWTQEGDSFNDTGWCPDCHIDSIIGDASGINLTNELLIAMNEQYFDAQCEDENENKEFFSSFEELVRAKIKSS